MKYVTLFLLLAMSLVSHAAVEEESSSGIYTACSRWTTLNGVEQSKEFRYTLNDDDSMSFEVLLHVGTSKCEAIGESRYRVENFTIKDKIEVGNSIFMLIAKNEETGDYYQIFFRKNAVSLDISKTFPIQVDLNRSYYLKKLR